MAALQAAAASVSPTKASPLQALLAVARNMVPDNVVLAAVNMNILGIITFSLFFGICLASMGSQADAFINLITVRTCLSPSEVTRCLGPILSTPIILPSLSWRAKAACHLTPNPYPKSFQSGPPREGAIESAEHFPCPIAQVQISRALMCIDHACWYPCITLKAQDALQVFNKVIGKMVSVVLWTSPVGIASLIAAAICRACSLLGTLAALGLWLTTVLAGVLLCIRAAPALPAPALGLVSKGCA